MKYLTVLSAIAGASLAFPFNSLLSSSSKTPKGTIQLEMRHLRKGGRIGKRDLDKVYGSYSIVFEVGTPGQQMQALLDTGSSDLWVNTPDTDSTPNFDPSKSSTYYFNNSNFDIQYGSGSASGDWATDRIVIAGAEINNQSMGVVYDPSAGESIMGVGTVDNESSDVPYINIPQNLKDQGHIKHNAYSLYLDNLETSTGRVLFGGVDHEKYTGELMTVPFVDDAAFYIEVNGIKIGGKSVASSSFSGLVDSGTTFTYLPVEAAKSVASTYGATYDEMTGLYFVSDKNSNQGDFEFDFSGATIKVPSREMVVPSSEIIDGNAPMPYVLGVVPSYDPPFILGDTFLRSVYAVYDLENRQLSLAQASYTEKSNINVIEGRIPGAKGAPRAAAARGVAAVGSLN